MGEWKVASVIAALSIFYKRIGEGENTFEEKLGQVLERKREKLEKLKTGSREE